MPIKPGMIHSVMTTLFPLKKVSYSLYGSMVYDRTNIVNKKESTFMHYIRYVNCKTKIHPHFINSGIYLYKSNRKITVDFTFTNIYYQINVDVNESGANDCICHRCPNKCYFVTKLLTGWNKKFFKCGLQ